MGHNTYEMEHMGCTKGPSRWFQSVGERQICPGCEMLVYVDKTGKQVAIDRSDQPIPNLTEPAIEE